MLGGAGVGLVTAGASHLTNNAGEGGAFEGGALETTNLCSSCGKTKRDQDT